MANTFFENLNKEASMSEYITFLNNQAVERHKLSEKLDLIFKKLEKIEELLDEEEEDGGLIEKLAGDVMSVVTSGVK